ncbi:Detected protein of confused Function [Hibiscus syriacus]|uniref:Detected protein of confused Function n=1 Tax=Hibiscus syriacus TaxID=106335 RepID=A0A6A3CY17_HIBSY|nr:Detected protein of confused Function [Hibiscus syriacus]
MDLILPDDLLEQILAYLPVANFFRAGTVCRRWHEIVNSRGFLWNFSDVLSQKPWYFMFTSSDEPVGYAYDPILRKWYGIELPCIQTPNWFIASSCGLVVSWTMTLEVSCMSAIRSPKIARSSRIPRSEIPSLWCAVDIETMMWTTSLTEVLTGWRGGDTCNGVLYFLTYSSGGDTPENRHGLVTYSFSNRSSPLIRSFIPVPGPLTCGRLMNLNEKPVMVGGIGKQDRLDVIKGIGIWVLEGRNWVDVARMPRAPALLVFDMNLKLWKSAQKCPVSKKFPLQLFSGSCF